MTISGKRKRRYKMHYKYINTSRIMWSTYKVTGHAITYITEHEHISKEKKKV